MNLYKTIQTEGEEPGVVSAYPLSVDSISLTYYGCLHILLLINDVQIQNLSVKILLF